MTRAQLSSPIVTSLKDRLRFVQFQMRRRARSAQNVVPGLQMIPRPLAAAADAFMTHVQSATMKILPDGARQSSNYIFPAPISAYFFPEAEDFREFAPEIYYAIKSLVRGFSDGDCLISETAIDGVGDRMQTRHGERLAGARAGDLSDAVAACAALAAELAALRPIRAWVWQPRRESSPRHFFLSPNQYVAFVIGLSMAVKSSRKDLSIADDEVVNLVDYAVDSRFVELSAAITSRNPVEHLKKTFAEILPFIA